MNNRKNSIFIDFEHTNLLKLSDEEMAKSLLNKFKPILTSVGKRVRQLKSTPMLYDTQSVALYDQAKDLYFLGYFVSAILVCRTTAEHLAYEIFYEEMPIQGDQKTIELLAESLDFRKIVNSFLYDEDKGIKIIDRETHRLFNELYSLGNQWVHPKSVKKGIKIEQEAFNAIEKLRKLIDKSRNVLNDYAVANGVLVQRKSARKKVRPIKLFSPRNDTT